MRFQNELLRCTVIHAKEATGRRMSFSSLPFNFKMVMGEPYRFFA